MTKIIKHIADITYQGAETIFTFGLPLPKGQVAKVNELQLCQNKELLSAYLTPVGYWNDNSIRWLKCQTIVGQSGIVDVLLNNDSDTCESFSVVESKTNSFKSSKNIIFQTCEDSLKASIKLKLCDHETPLNFIKQKNISKLTPLTETYTITGIFKFNKRQLKLNCHIEVCKYTGDIGIKLRLHNPHAAAHTGGQWDLGDKNSIIIEDFSLILQLADTQASVVINDTSIEAQEPVDYEGDYTLKQYSSGGDNWQSPIHWDENKNITVHKNGFELINEKDILLQGLRAAPVAALKNKEKLFKMKLEGFWQNFPITLIGNKDSLSWKLLAKNTELQGGESKTWVFRCNLKTPRERSESDKKISNLAVPHIRYNTEYLAQCNILPHLSFSKSRSALTKLIHIGIDGEQDFFKKREKNDVYGWRNYGELDADHEAVNKPENSYFISHYNNQYDPLMGMTLQFLHHGDPKWLQLLKPLNQHIQDIDIYDTKDDKAEYNGGFFWHTDHYLSAQTCSHRSNSKHHIAAYDGFLGGGGPGGQHCYTTGLTLQYWLFGDEEAKTKVAQLCTWIRHFYDGSDSIAERTFRLLTIDFKQNELTNIGVKAPGYKYPLDRGTGNFLVALIDNYDLRETPALLQEMGQIIRQTFHPLEDISLRQLNNHENAWFYTVFLQSVVRYLLLKESRNNIDDDYWYARHGLMHYCHWMIENESFYLDHPEQLEFPNDTWCAQELRKANLFYYAYYFSKDHESLYIDRAEEFYNYVTNRLTKSNEAHHTRILAIMMQNDGVQQKFNTKPVSPIPYETKQYVDAPGYDRNAIVLTYMKDAIKILLHFSPRSEWSWLTKRLFKIFNKS